MRSRKMEKTKKYTIQGNGTVPGIKKEWQEADNRGRIHSYISVEEHPSIPDAIEKFEDEEMSYEEEEHTSAMKLKNFWDRSHEYETPEGDKLYEWLDKNSTSYSERDGFSEMVKNANIERKDNHFVFNAEMTSKQFLAFQKWNESGEYDIEEDGE